jgi:hypothetical protein
MKIIELYPGGKKAYDTSTQHCELNVVWKVQQEFSQKKNYYGQSDTSIVDAVTPLDASRLFRRLPSIR